MSASLEQFLALAKTAKGAAAVALIKQVLEAPNIYVFGEILDCTSVKQLKENPHHKPYLDLLELFAYGTCKDYLGNKASYPELTPPMIKKLRHLTIASLVLRSKNIPYGLLLKELDLHNVRELEDTVIEAIYCGVIKGCLDQKKQVLEVQYAIGRDVRMEDIPRLYSILSDWLDTCNSTLSDIQTQIVTAEQNRQQEVKLKQQTDNEIANIRKTLKVASTSSSSDRQSARASTSTETMDTGEPKAVKKASKTKGLRGSNIKLFKSGTS